MTFKNIKLRTPEERAQLRQQEIDREDAERAIIDELDALATNESCWQNSTIRSLVSTYQGFGYLTKPQWNLVSKIIIRNKERS
jgi:hypothetical protein